MVLIEKKVQPLGMSKKFAASAAPTKRVTVPWQERWQPRMWPAQQTWWLKTMANQVNGWTWMPQLSA